jgi:glutathione synthase/RimK-type ligase-like ATP-grasp enzyme
VGAVDDDEDGHRLSLQRALGLKPVLIVTNRADRTADWLILELHARGTEFVRFNTEDYPRLVQFTWDMSDCRLNLGGRWLSLGDVRSIWYRRPIAPELDATVTDEHAQWIVGEALEALRGAWRTYNGLWVNHPDANDRASSKLEQLRRARRMGFAVPETIVTSNPRDLHEFAKSRRQPLVCKPLKSGYVKVGGEERLFFTSLVGEEDFAAFESGGPEPYLFQHLVEKDHELRVTVIGERVFGVRLESQVREATRIDWRRGDQAQLKHTPVVLPDEMAHSCLELVRGYGLAFGAIDLAVGKDGRHVFFEINPNGQWAWIEQLTGLPMRASLADLLQSGVGS